MALPHVQSGGSTSSSDSPSSSCNRRAPTSCWIARKVFFRRLRRLLGLDGAQAADPFVDGHQVRAQLLEAAELGNLAVSLAALGRIGQGLLAGLAAELVRKTHLGAVAGIVVLGAGAVGFAATAEGGMDGTGAEVAELGDCEQELGAALFQEGVGQGASFVWCTKYPQISEAKPTARLLRHNHVAHPQKSQKLTSKLTSFIVRSCEKVPKVDFYS